MSRSFSGTSQYLTVSAGLTFPFSISAHVFRTASSASYSIVNLNPTASDTNYHWFYTTSGRLVSIGSAAGSTEATANSASAYTNSVWFHGGCVVASATS